MKKYKIGYTQGTYDMFHIGHLKLICNAKMQCEKLIVGINSDKLVEKYKKKKPIINEQERMAIVGALRYVDGVVLSETLRKIDSWNKFHYNAIFIGSDWQGDERWKQTEKDLFNVGVDVVYLPHTDGISSSILREKLFPKGSETCQGTPNLFEPS